MTKNVDIQTEQQLGEISEFFSGVPSVMVLPCDDPFEGVLGVIVYNEIGGNEEQSVWFRKRIYNAVSYTKVFDGDSDPVDAEAALARCLREPEWFKADNPKRLMIGFVKSEPLGSPRGSQAVMFNLEVIKNMPKDLRNELEMWRKAKE